jgi:mitogen-activated protein kinase 1/3
MMKAKDKEDFDPEITKEFDILKPLGCGAFATVFKAVHKKTGTECAIKKVSGIFDDLGDCRRILREVELLSILKHPNIIRLIDFRAPKDPNFTTIYLILEITSTDLEKVIDNEKGLDPKEVKKFVYDILKGLKYMHSAGVIHRDLKPANVLLDQNRELRICDYKSRAKRG